MPLRRVLRVVLWVFLVGGPCRTLIAKESPLAAMQSEYREIVDEYRRGDVAGAVERIGAWRGSRLEPRGWEPDELAAACSLHLELIHQRPDAPGVEAHLAAMREHLRRLRVAAERPAVTASLHLGLALWFQGQLRLEDLGLYFEEIGGSFPNDAGLLLAEAVFHETLASRRLERARAAYLVPSSKHSLETAARLFEAALAAAPDSADARLRLAHVLILQGRTEDASRLLSRALSGETDPPRLYLAHLFAGQAHRMAGRAPEAEESFRAARAAYPCGQSAWVAQAQRAYVDGRIATARETLSAGLEASRDCTDPWALYDFGSAPELGDLIASLRRQVAR